jgi:hypothetical protein
VAKAAGLNKKTERKPNPMVFSLRARIIVSGLWHPVFSSTPICTYIFLSSCSATGDAANQDFGV